MDLTQSFLEQLNQGLFVTILSIGMACFFTGYAIGKKVSVIRRVFQSSI